MTFPGHRRTGRMTAAAAAAASGCPEFQRCPECLSPTSRSLRSRSSCRKCRHRYRYCSAGGRRCRTTCSATRRSFLHWRRRCCQSRATHSHRRRRCRCRIQIRHVRIRRRCRRCRRRIRFRSCWHGRTRHSCRYRHSRRTRCRRYSHRRRHSHRRHHSHRRRHSHRSHCLCHSWRHRMLRQ